MNQKTLLQNAIEFASVKHAGQFRKGTTIPYITHVLEAMEIVSRMTDDEEIRAAAVLHDTLEDTDTTKDELVSAFGQRVADLVAAESEDKREDQPEAETWLTRKQETIRHLAHAGTEIRMIALGDKLSNVRSMHRDYQVVGEELWQRFNQKDPVKQGMYYGLLANVFGEDEVLRETPAYREYVELCAGLFSKTYDGDGNVIDEEGEEDDEKDADDGPLPIRFFFADAMDEVRSELPEGAKAWALIMDKTEDEDLQEIQKMAATLDAFLRTDDVGFGNVHLQIENDPSSGDVSWKKTEDGYALHLCAESGKNWCQVAYQLGYLMMHCLIDHLSDDEEGISWVEELISEVAALDLLSQLMDNWERTPFGREDPDYADSIDEYIASSLEDEGTDALLKCGSKEELEEINRRNSFDDRLGESHDLYWKLDDGDLLRQAGVREYEADDLLLYTHYWRGFSDGSEAVDFICHLQERIPGCEIPAGINQEVELQHTEPSERHREAFRHMIHALRHMPCEFVIFSFKDDEDEEPGLAFYQVLRRENGQIMAEIRLETENGPKMYRITVDEDQAIEILNGILDTKEAPDLAGWEDVTADILGDQEEKDSADDYDDDEYDDLNEWDIWENILHPNGRESDRED